MEDHGFDGVKHLMWVMFQIMLFQKYLWLLLWIYVMILMGDKRFFMYYLELFDCFSDHTRYKYDVGYRLSRSGLAIAYGQQVEFQGPIVQAVAYTNGS